MHYQHFYVQLSLIYLGHRDGEKTTTLPSLKLATTLPDRRLSSDSSQQPDMKNPVQNFTHYNYTAHTITSNLIYEAPQRFGRIKIALWLPVTYNKPILPPKIS